MNGIAIRLVTVTPEMAQAMLGNEVPTTLGTTSDREAAERYAAAMKDGTWRLNGDTIVIGD